MDIGTPWEDHRVRVGTSGKRNNAWVVTVRDGSRIKHKRFQTEGHAWAWRGENFVEQDITEQLQALLAKAENAAGLLIDDLQNVEDLTDSEGRPEVEAAKEFVLLVRDTIRGMLVWEDTDL